MKRMSAAGWRPARTPNRGPLAALLAGFGTGGTGRFNWPSGVAVDSSGTAYVGDAGNNRIRKIQ